MTHFSEANVPDQSGKTFLVTGANTGIGFHTARVLAARDGQVILACRDPAKAQQAARQIRQEVPAADLKLLTLDLADLESVARAADQVQRWGALDVLINNAGVMMPPLGHTAQGLELQFGVNHLGHFALTGHLLGLLAASPVARVVTLSSVVHRGGRIDFADPHAKQSYSRRQRYAMSKLANLMFSYELHRRLQAMGSKLQSIACHPGVADTELARHVDSSWLRALRPLVTAWLNSPLEGALPSLLAATGTKVKSGDFYGPTRRWETARGARPRQAGRACPKSGCCRTVVDLVGGTHRSRPACGATGRFGPGGQYKIDLDSVTPMQRHDASAEVAIADPLHAGVDHHL